MHLRQPFDPQTDEATFHLGVHDAVLPVLVAPLLARLPETVRVHVHPPADGRALHTGDVDLLLGPPLPEDLDLEQEGLYTDVLVAIGTPAIGNPVHDPEAARTSVPTCTQALQLVRGTSLGAVLPQRFLAASGFDGSTDPTGQELAISMAWHYLATKDAPHVWLREQIRALL